jgi:hypothetical protein
VRTAIGTGGDLASFLAGWRFRYAGEKELQAAIAGALDAAGVPFEREVRLGKAGTIDFLIGGGAPGGLGIGLEIKVGGSVADLTRQLFRYAGEDRVREVVLATTRRAHAFPDATMQGKPARCVVLAGAFA